MSANGPEKTRQTLLIVEDDPLTRNTLQRLIAVKYPALSISSAENGCAGLASFRELRQDIVITDLCMPKMDGDQMAEEILAIDASTVIIAITAHFNKDRLARARTSGISHFLNKPVEFKDLFTVINACLK